MWLKPCNEVIFFFNFKKSTFFLLKWMYEVHYIFVIEDSIKIDWWSTESYSMQSTSSHRIMIFLVLNHLFFVKCLIALYVFLCYFILS